MTSMIRNLAIAAVAATTLAATDAAAAPFTTGFVFSNGGGTGTGTNLSFGAFDFALAITSNDNGVSGIFSTWTTTATANINVAGEWNYGTQDIGGSSFDVLGYFIDDVFTTLVQLSTDGISAPAFQNGTFNFNIAAGQTFGFYMLATDGILGAANGTLLGNITVAPIPLPAGGLLLVGALGGLVLLRRRKDA